MQWTILAQSLVPHMVQQTLLEVIPKHLVRSKP